jgi:hypothetical protein
MIHHFHLAGTTDLKVIQKQAHEQAMATGLYRPLSSQELEEVQESSIIHFHSHGEDCDGRKHEYYRAGSGLVKNEGEAPTHG